MCYKSTDLRTRWFIQNFCKNFSIKVNHRETNFIIGGFLAGLHRSPLICLWFQDLLATFGSVEDSFSPLIIQALSGCNGSFGLFEFWTSFCYIHGSHFFFFLYYLWVSLYYFQTDPKNMSDVGLHTHPHNTHSTNSILRGTSPFFPLTSSISTLAPRCESV